MKSLAKLLEQMLIEDLVGSPNWESSWWTEAVFRGLQEGEDDERGPESDPQGLD